MVHIKKYIAKKFKVLDEYIELISMNLKKSTIRRGIVFVADNFIPIESNKRKVFVKITKIDYSKTFDDLDENDAIIDGFKSLFELKLQLKSFYPDILENDPVTIIYFERV